MLILICFSLAITTPLFAQTAAVEVGGDVEKSFKITGATFAEFKQVSVKVKTMDGREHEYVGIKLYDLLTKAQAVPNNQLRGKSLSKYILISAADGYQVVIALPEIDPAFTDNAIILANKMDGEDLPANFGPYRLIVPSDKKPARSVMRVTRIDIFTAKQP